MFNDYRQEVTIPCGNRKLAGELVIPANATSIIIFSQGGASRKSTRSRVMAGYFQQHGFGTLLPDLLAEEEEGASGKQYDVELLSTRLTTVTQWVMDRDLFDHYRLGYYATSTGAAAALCVAAQIPEKIDAIVCRGGRPDLAKMALPGIAAPTLFIVGDLDHYVLQLNREALEELNCSKQLEVIIGATHLFEGDKLNEMAEDAMAWFERYLHPSKVVNH